MSLYSEAIFERGSGLGNRLFPWARARIFAATNGIRMFAPRWVSARVGPLIRLGGDIWSFPRQGLLIGQFEARDDDVTGVRRRLIRHLSTIHRESPDFATKQTNHFESGSHLIQFRGDLTGSGRFKSIQGHDEFLRKELEAITQDRWLESAEETRDTPIGIHVRLTDFRTGPEESFNAEGSFKGAVRTPMEWYVGTLRLLREALGSPFPAFVVSDGKPGEMQQLLDMQEVSLVRSRSPISDMWSLAHCRVLLASIGSSFSAWASFLGQMPTVVYPLPEAHAFPIENRKRLYNGPLDPDHPEAAFLRSLATCM
jgi:hypothetical protein